MKNSEEKMELFYAKLDTFFKNKETKKPSILKIIITLLILSIIISFIIINQKNCNINIFHVLALLLQYIACLLMLVAFISITVNKKYERREWMAFVINILFILSTSLLIFNVKCLDNVISQIISLTSQLIMLFHINKYVKINRGDDLSFLKATNYIMASIVTAFTFLNVKNITNEHIKSLIESSQSFIGFYYVAPLIMLQGLYELLDRKSKKFDTPNSKVPPHVRRNVYLIKCFVVCRRTKR